MFRWGVSIGRAAKAKKHARFRWVDIFTSPAKKKFGNDFSSSGMLLLLNQQPARNSLKGNIRWSKDQNLCDHSYFHFHTLTVRPICWHHLKGWDFPQPNFSLLLQRAIYKKGHPPPPEVVNKHALLKYLTATATGHWPLHQAIHFKSTDNIISPWSASNSSSESSTHGWPNSKQPTAAVDNQKINK